MDESTPPKADLPVVAPPVERKSQKLTVGDYLNEALTPLLVTIGGGVAGYSLGKYAPKSLLNNLSERAQSLMKVLWKDAPKIPLTPERLAIRGAAIAGIYSAFHHWRKDEKRRLGVKDIHTDFYAEIDPALLKSEVQQNQRIQEGLTRMVQPRGSYTQEALKEEPAATVSR